MYRAIKRDRLRALRRASGGRFYLCILIVLRWADNGTKKNNASALQGVNRASCTSLHIPKQLLGHEPGTPHLTSPQSFGFISHGEELVSVWEGKAHLERWLDELQADRFRFFYCRFQQDNYSFRLPSSGRSNVSRAPPSLGEPWGTDVFNWTLGKAKHKTNIFLTSRKALSVVLFF